MKAKHLLIAALIIVNCQLIIGNCFGQNIAINTTGAPAAPSAYLDISGTNAGLLIPRMTTAQRNAITSPANFLMICNTTTGCFEAYNTATSTWQSIYCLCTIPGAPTANAASSVASTSFSANWTASAGATAYLLDVATDAGFTVFVGVFNNFNVGNVVTYPVTGLTSGTTYYYRVRANNTCGTSGNSGTITVTTTSCYTPGTQTFNYTGGSQSFTVGCGVTSITVDVKGAQGGDNPTAFGGLGGRVQGTIAVTPFEVLTIYVGGTTTSCGAGGYNGGGNSGCSYAYSRGGGGASDIRRTPYALGDRLVVGAGGGGTGYNYNTTCDNGGNGGGTTGTTAPVCSGTGGGGGTQSAGGAGGTWSGYPNGMPGTLGIGGDYGSGGTGGGGGGGGYYGGGGGCWGGGGGGSSLVPGGGSTTSGFQTGNGQIIITW